jgi:HAD superfamily hydrolase (TIGR01509 family)
MNGLFWGKGKHMNSSREYTTIIFDLTGVIFKVNKLDICKRLGLLRTFWYVLTHRKNPVRLYLNALNALCQLPSHNPLRLKQNMCFGSLIFPSCITEYFTGKKTGLQTAHDLYSGVQTLDAQNYFTSAQERALLEHIIANVFVKERNANGFTPLKKNVRLLKKLKESYKLFLLSNFDKETFEKLYQTHRSIFDLFDGIIVSGQVGLLKPYKEVYHYLLDTYQVDPTKTIFIDDQEENIKEPQKMGITTILYKNRRQMLKELKQCLGSEI